MFCVILNVVKNLAKSLAKSLRGIAFGPFGRRTSFLPPLRSVRMTLTLRFCFVE